MIAALFEEELCRAVKKEMRFCSVELRCEILGDSLRRPGPPPHVLGCLQGHSENPSCGRSEELFFLLDRETDKLTVYPC